MLVNLNDVLLDAKRRKYGVGLFNAVNLELARGIIQAAEQTGSPVIMGTAEVLFPYGPLEDRKSGSAGMPRPISSVYLVCRLLLEKKKK